MLVSDSGLNRLQVVAITGLDESRKSLSVMQQQQ